jgi:serine/threonine protein kinase
MSSHQQDLQTDDLALVLGKQIGEGGFATVHVGEYCSSPCAVKILKSFDDAVGISEENKRRNAGLVLKSLQEEIKIMQRVSHPNCVRFFDSREHNGSLCVVMELCTSGSYWSVLKREAAEGVQLLSLEQKADILCGVSRGMAYLHSRRPPIVHRDLKSANVLIGSNNTAKVTDFGISRTQSGPDEVMMNTKAGSHGTVPYMAPELLNESEHDQSVDVYAFAMIIFETLAKKIPFSGVPQAKIIMRVCFKHLRPELPEHAALTIKQPLGQLFYFLMVRCWAQSAKLRPSFPLLAKQFESSGREAYLQLAEQGCTFVVVQGVFGMDTTESTDFAYTLQYDRYTSTGEGIGALPGAEKLKAGMALVTLNDADLAGVPYAEVVERMQHRPCKLHFVPQKDTSEYLPQCSPRGTMHESSGSASPIERSRASSSPAPSSSSSSPAPSSSASSPSRDSAASSSSSSGESNPRGGSITGYHLRDKLGRLLGVTGRRGQQDAGVAAGVVAGATMQGILHKKGHKFRNWKERYFVLDADNKTVAYYTDKAVKVRKGGLVIARVVDLADRKDKLACRFDFIGHRASTEPTANSLRHEGTHEEIILSVAASSADEKYKWIQAVQNASADPVAQGADLAEVFTGGQFVADKKGQASTACAPQEPAKAPVLSPFTRDVAHKSTVDAAVVSFRAKLSTSGIERYAVGMQVQQEGASIKVVAQPGGAPVVGALGVVFKIVPAEAGARTGRGVLFIRTEEEDSPTAAFPRARKTSFKAADAANDRASCDGVYMSMEQLQAITEVTLEEAKQQALLEETGAQKRNGDGETVGVMSEGDRAGAGAGGGVNVGAGVDVGVDVGKGEGTEKLVLVSPGLVRHSTDGVEEEAKRADLRSLGTSDITKYRVGQHVSGMAGGQVSGRIVSITPRVPGASTGPGVLVLEQVNSFSSWIATTGGSDAQVNVEEGRDKQ